MLVNTAREFWPRAQLSKEVLSMIWALDAAADNQPTQSDRQCLSDAINLLATINETRDSIREIDITSRWALNALKLQSATRAFASIENQDATRDLQTLLDQIKAVLEALLADRSVCPTELALARRFFRAFEEVLIDSFSSSPERAPIKYI